MAGTSGASEPAKKSSRPGAATNTCWRRVFSQLASLQWIWATPSLLHLEVIFRTKGTPIIIFLPTLSVCVQTNRVVLYLGVVALTQTISCRGNALRERLAMTKQKQSACFWMTCPQMRRVPYSSPLGYLVVVVKTDGSWRLCLVSRHLDAGTFKVCIPLQRQLTSSLIWNLLAIIPPSTTRKDDLEGEMDSSNLCASLVFSPSRSVRIRADALCFVTRTVYVPHPEHRNIWWI